MNMEGKQMKMGTHLEMEVEQDHNLVVRRLEEGVLDVAGGR
jgi:hypothetical protein